jgi:hypothetical protein
MSTLVLPYIKCISLQAFSQTSNILIQQNRNQNSTTDNPGNRLTTYLKTQNNNDKTPMYETKIQDLHSQLMADYDKLASAQAELLSARKALHEVRASQRGDTQQTLRTESQVVNHDLARCLEELEEVRREKETLENTHRNGEKGGNTMIEKFAPRKTNKNENLRAKFVEQPGLMRFMGPPVQDGKGDDSHMVATPPNPLMPREQLRGLKAYPMKGREPGQALSQEKVGQLTMKDFLPRGLFN